LLLLLLSLCGCMYSFQRVEGWPYSDIWVVISVAGDGFATEGTTDNLLILEGWIRAAVCSSVMVLVTKNLQTSWALKVKEIQLSTVLHFTLPSNIWELHSFQRYYSQHSRFSTQSLFSFPIAIARRRKKEGKSLFLFSTNNNNNNNNNNTSQSTPNIKVVYSPKISTSNKERERERERVK
jgi:hypothetical protein